MSQNTTSDIHFKALNGQFNIDESQGIVECFVAAIGNKDSVGDVIVSGAFNESLKRRKPRVVWGHSWNDPIGKVIEIYEVPANDPRLPAKMKQAGVGGVYARVQFNLATEKGREAFSSVAFFGPEQEWSIGYKTLNATFDPSVQANILREVELYEVSPVLHGANQLTATISVKSEEGEKCGGPMGMPNAPHMYGGTPAPSTTPRIVSVDANRLSPIRVISGINQQPSAHRSDNSREDIFGEGEARTLSDEARNMLAMELMTRSRANLDIIYATENSVVFNREVGQGNKITYRLSYYREPGSGEYMFGKPEKMGMHSDDSRIASHTVIPSQMPSMPMTIKPQSVNPYSITGVPSAVPQMGNYGMEKSLDFGADTAADFVLSGIQDGSISSSTGNDKIDAVIDILKGMTGKSDNQQVFTIACEPYEAFHIKSAIDPVLEYHRLDVEIDEYGIHVVNGLSTESISALTKAAESIETITTKVGGSKKIQAPLVFGLGLNLESKGLGPKLGTRLSGGLRAAPPGMSFIDITGTVDADTDGIVFEGKPGLERPIIPRFIVPKNLARKISSLTEGDALEIEKQRRSGNTNISFDETKLRSIIEKIGGNVDSLKPAEKENTDGMRSSSMSDGLDSQEPPVEDTPEQYDGLWTPDEDQLRDLDKRSGRTTPRPPPANIGQKYVISRDDDGVYFAENISAEDVWSLRSGASEAPKRPFFAPRGGGNQPGNGEGYYFSTNGKRYWGKYGAAGALVRRKNSDGEYEYFLARRAKGMSVGGGKWSFPGGAHKDKDNSKLPGATAIEEFGEEVGGDISSLKPVHTYTDQVAPDWKYDTYVFEVGPDELDDLRSMDGESTDTGWFTASDIMQMAGEGKLLDSFKRSAKEVFALSGDEVKGNKTTRKIKKAFKKISGQKVTSWREKIREYEPIQREDYFDINDEMQSDFGISIGQVMQDEYDEGASIKEIAENWGLTTHEVEKLLDDNGKDAKSSMSIGQIMQDEYDEGASIKEIAENWTMTTQEVEEFMGRTRPGGMSSTRSRGNSQTQNEITDDDGQKNSLADFISEKTNPLALMDAYERAVKKQGTSKADNKNQGMRSEAKVPVSKDMSGLSDDELISKLDENVNSLNELETLLDDGEIDLAEYRKRQVPLRKEAAGLGAEKKRRSGTKSQTGETGTPKREKVIDRGDGMIKRDERGNPSEWNGQKFLDGEAGKRRQAILELGFTEEEADTLLGPRPSPQKSGMGSRSSAKTKPSFSLTPLNLFIKRETTRTKGPVPELSGWSDRELADALSMYDIRAPRSWDKERGSFIPSWFPSKESLVREFDSRGYNVFLGTSGSRQYNDLVFSTPAKDNATPEEMRRRIWKPSGLLTQSIRNGEEETGQVFPLKSRMKNWEFAAQAADMTDAEVRSLDIEFDNERTNKLADVRSGIISKEQFNKWYEEELTPLRRALSAELTRRSLRKAVDGKQTIESVFGTGLTPREYAFLSKDPLLFTRSAGMMSRSGGSIIDKMVQNGEVTQDDLEFMQQYHDLSDRLNFDLINELTKLFGAHPDEVDWDSLDIDTKLKSRDIHNKWMRKYSASLSQLGDGQKRNRNELANMGFDDGEIDDIMTGSISSGTSVGQLMQDEYDEGATLKDIASNWDMTIAEVQKAMRNWSSGGMSSKRKSNRKITPKWSEEDRRAFTEQNLRSKKVPKKKKRGPAANEWTERRAGREIKSTTRVSNSPYSDAAKTASYYESLANQYFSGVAEFVGEDTRIVNNNYNANIPTLDEPFASIRTSTVGSLKDGDFLPDGFDAPSMFSTPTNPRYKVVYVSKDKDGQIVFGARDLQTGELLVKKMGVNEILPNVMRQSTNKRFGGMSSSRKVGDVKLHAKLADQFKFEQFDEIEKDLNSLLEEIRSIDEQLNILFKNTQRRTEAGLEGPSDYDEKRYGDLEDVRSSLQDTIGEYVKFAEFVAQENIMRRRHKAAVKLAKERVQNELKKQKSPSGNPFEMSDYSTRRLFELGVTEADIADMLDSFDIDERDMERVFTAGRPPFTGTKLAKQIASIMDNQSSINGPEFEEFDPEDEDEQYKISKLATRMINSAAYDAASRSKIADRSKTMIEVGVSSSSSGGMSSKTPMGKGLGTSKVIYPTRPNKFIAKDVSFVSYDANRGELSVGYKDKKKYVFGGITPEMIDDIENGKNSLIASLNAIKKDARYTVNPDGTIMGSRLNTLQLLNRDKDRLKLIGDDLEVVESVIDGLKNGQNDMTRKMQSDRRNEAMSMASGLAKNNEYAMAFNIMDALDEIETRTNGSGYMPNGMRSYAATIHLRVQVGLSQDEVGEIRDEIRAIMRKHNANFFIKEGLSKYDKNLADAQKKEGRAQLVLLLPEYNAIMNAYEELAKVDPQWVSVVGPHPVELAGISKDGRFDTEKFKEVGDFAGKLINNGAPSDITVAEQRELINWARRQPGFRIVQSIASSYDEKNGALTANQWRTLRSLQRNYGKNQYNRGGLESRRSSVGMRSSSETDGGAPRDAIAANTMGRFVPYGGPNEGGSRNAEVIPNVDIKGKSIEQAIPEGLSNEEALALIEDIGAYHPKANPDGIKGREYVERRTRLLDSIAETRRITERRAALERAQQSGQIGDDVNLPSHLEFWPLVSEETKSKLNTAAQNKYGVQFIDLEPYQMEDVLVFETGASGYYSNGTFKQIKKRPNAIEIEDWERLLLPIHQRVNEIDEEEAVKREAARLEVDNSPTLEEMLNDPNIAPERKERIERVLSVRREAEQRWKNSAENSSSKRRSAAAKEIKLQKYETIDDVGRSSVKNIETMSQAKYGSKFDSLTPVQQRDVLDSYAKQRFGVEHYRNVEQSVQKAQSQAERFSQQERIDGEHLAAWDSITDFFTSSKEPSFTREKIDSLREMLDDYPTENENSTDAELLLSNKIEDISSLLDEMEMSYDDENITIPSGRTDGMASNKKFTPRGVEVERDESSSRIGGMSSLFNRNKPDKGDPDTGKAKTPDKPSKPERKKPIVTDGWKKVSWDRTGSNPGGLFEDENGVRHYVKTPPSLSHVESEVLAAELYKLLDIGVPQISQGSYQGKPVVISTLISEPSRPITGAMGDGSEQWKAKVLEGFIGDAWLANWDATLHDNVRADKNGNPIRVDNGGSMKWRARGERKKPNLWDANVGEIDSLKGGNNPSAPLYRLITEQQTRDQVAKLEAISPETIKATVASIISDPAEAKELTDTLLARRQNLISRFGTGRSSGMSSRTTGMSSLFNRNKPDKTEADTGTVKASDKPSKPERKKPIVTDGWKKVGGQGGSNPGGFFEDENGVRHYVKTPPSLSHIESEVLAAELYKLLGLGVPQISQGSFQGKPVVVSTLISEPSRPITGATGDGSKQWQAKVIEGFVGDAWLANWDATLNDNVRADKNGNPIRVDNGGSMKWRARGGPKGAAWGTTVGEIDSLRGTNPSAPVYRQITDQQIKDQVAKLEAISPETIKATVASIISDPAEAKELTDTLLARRKDLINRFGKGGSSGMSSRTTPKPMPEFGSQKFMNSLPATLRDLSNEELMQMWDSTKPFVNLQQYEMGENAKNLNIRMEKIKKDIRQRIKSEVSLRSDAPTSRSEKINQGSAEAMSRAFAERKNRSEAIKNALNNRSDAIKKYYSSTRMEDDQHTAIWDEVNDALMADGDADITLSKLDSMIQLLDDYISANKKDVSKSEQRRNVGQAEKIRSSLTQLAEKYASDPYVRGGGEESEKPKTPRINRNGTEIQNPASENNNVPSRISMAPTRTTARYTSARKGEARAEGMRSSTGMSSRTGRAEIRGEATFFKSIQDMLLHEAGKSDNSDASSALRTLHTIMTRQKSGLISDKRTNAGAIYLMQDELDNILDALFLSIDRQVGRDNADRAKLLSDFADMLAMAGMATFIDKSVPEVNSRTVKKFNSEGREVEIPLNE